MSKKIITLILITALMLCAFPAHALNYDTEGAYNECYALYPDFIEKVKSKGVGDKHIISFMNSVRDFLLESEEELTEENFDAQMFDAIKKAFDQRKHIGVRNALSSAYPNSVNDSMKGIVTEEFMPIYLTIKRYIFGIFNPVVTLSNSNGEILVHHVRMPEDARIIIALYDSEGTLLKAKISSSINEYDTEGCHSARVFAFKGASLSPLCESYTLNLKDAE